MESAEEKKRARPLSIQQVADVLQQFAGSGAEWFMSPASFLDGETFYRQPRKVDLLVWLNGHEMGRWRLLPVSFGSLVTRHAKAPEGTFAIPHASCYQYAEYPLLKPLKQRAQALLDSMAPAVNVLWKQVYALDDTPGLPTSSAEGWWTQAEQAFENSWWTRLRELQKEVGAPDYLQHTSQLAEVLPKAQDGLSQLRKFLAEVPLPDVTTDTSAELTPGDGSRYPFRHFVSPNVNAIGPFFSSKFKREGLEGAPFADNEEAEGTTSSPTALREQLLEMRERIDQVLSLLE